MAAFLPPDSRWSPARWILASRWLLAPMYAILIAVQVVFVIKFFGQFLHVVQAWLGDAAALAHVVEDIGFRSAKPVTRLSGFVWILAVLELIETMMIATLLQIMLVGGYKTYVGEVRPTSSPESLSWIAHSNATSLKLKLSLAIVGISSVNLLETFINAENYPDRLLWAQAGLHVVFLLSTLVIALIGWMDHRMHGGH